MITPPPFGKLVPKNNQKVALKRTDYLYYTVIEIKWKMEGSSNE